MDSRGRGKGLTKLTIDEMAHMVANSELKKNDKEYFTGVLYQKSLKNFKKTVNSFFLDRKYSSRGFDENDLLSAYSLAFMRAIKGYDMSKGSFIARLSTFAMQEYVNLARYVMAKKRYGDGSVPESYEESLKVESCNTIELDELFSPTISTLIKEFIGADKEGKVISILLENSRQEDRRIAFEEFYGTYKDRERKRVQRTKERLKGFLSNNGVTF